MAEQVTGQYLDRVGTLNIAVENKTSGFPENYVSVSID